MELLWDGQTGQELKVDVVFVHGIRPSSYQQHDRNQKPSKKPNLSRALLSSEPSAFCIINKGWAHNGMSPNKMMRILSEELCKPEWLRLLLSASRCPEGTIDLLKPLIYRTGTGVSVKVKIYRLQPNTTEYAIPKPRPPKPPWSYQHSILPTNNPKMALKSSHSIAIPAQGADTYDSVPSWDIPPFEFQSFGGRETSYFALPETGQSIGLNPPKTQLTYHAAPNATVNTSSTSQSAYKQARRRKRNISAEMEDFGNTNKRWKSSFGCDADANETSFSIIEGSTHRRNLPVIHNDPPNSPAKSHKPRFPCPFYVRGLQTYSTKTHKTCMGDGWEIARLKEHIYRKHYQSPYTCRHCFKSFDNDEELYEHDQQKRSCERTQPAQSDFKPIDDHQMIQLKKRMVGKSDVEKWKTIYRIVFRLGPSAIIPSPNIKTHLAEREHPLVNDFEDHLSSLLCPSATERTKAEIPIVRQYLQSFWESREAARIASASDTPSSINDTNIDIDLVETGILSARGQRKNMAASLEGINNRFYGFRTPWQNSAGVYENHNYPTENGLGMCEMGWLDSQQGLLIGP